MRDKIDWPRLKHKGEETTTPSGKPLTHITLVKSLPESGESELRLDGKQIRKNAYSPRTTFREQKRKSTSVKARIEISKSGRWTVKHRS